MIYSYSRYNLETGRFNGQGSNPNQANVSPRGGFGLIEGHYDHSSQMVKGGVVVSIPKETLDQEKRKKAWSNLRPERNKRLQESDWTQVNDAPVNQVDWADYRQQLRDLPSNTEDPNNLDWPTRPE
jgi:hypothetical protein